MPHGEADPANGGIKGDGNTALFINNQYYVNDVAVADKVRQLFHYDMSSVVVNRPNVLRAIADLGCECRRTWETFAESSKNN